MGIQQQLCGFSVIQESSNPVKVSLLIARLGLSETESRGGGLFEINFAFSSQHHVSSKNGVVLIFPPNPC